MTISLLTINLLPEYLNVDSYRMPQFHPTMLEMSIPFHCNLMLVGLLDELSSTAYSETMVMFGCVVALNVT
jgi:hypothetical protein